jgi:DNA polymerase-3 subunit gamma/tau
MLSSAAFNAFLKTLEEPPAHAIFILATTEKHKILPTILSRVQKFDFKRIKVDAVAEHLKSICEKEGIDYEYDALQLIGLKADGGLRDGLSIFDQIVSFSNRHVTYKIVVDNLNVLDYAYYFKTVEMMLVADHEGLLVMLNEIIDNGFEVKDFLIGITEHFRNLLIARTPKTIGMLESSDNIKKQYTEQVKAISATLLLNAFNLASTAEGAMRNAVNPRLHVELALMKLAHLQTAINLAQENEKKKSERVGTQNLGVSTNAAVSKEIPAEGEVKSGISSLLPDKKSKVMRGPFLIPTNIDDIDLFSNSKGGKDEEQEAFVEYDERVTIDPVVFEAAYTKLLDFLNADGRYRVVSLLRMDAYRLDHNKWIQGVPSEVVRRQLADERFVIDYMREHTGVTNLLLEMEIQELAASANDSRPYTNEQKLDQMITQNPALRQLMKKFDAHVKYE